MLLLLPERPQTGRDALDGWDVALWDLSSPKSSLRQRGGGVLFGQTLPKLAMLLCPQEDTVAPKPKHRRNGKAS